MDHKTLHENVHKALKEWHEAPGDKSPLEALTLYQEMLRAEGSARRATNSLLYQALERLTHHHPDEAKLLKLRFLDAIPVLESANSLNMAEGTFYKRQREAIQALVDVVAELEQATKETQRRTLDARLSPAQHTALVGIEGMVAQVRAGIVVAGPPWFISLEGIGGIGKTTLAEAFLRSGLWRNDFVGFAWVTAKTQMLKLDGMLRAMPHPTLTVEALIEGLAAQLLGVQAPIKPEQALAAVQQRLQAQPHLVVIDNLETFQDVEQLMPTLRRLAGPSKFLITSRESLRGEGVYSVPVPELAVQDVVTLVRHEAQLRNLPHLLAMHDEELVPIYGAVGGNPLAVRLVVGQLHLYGLQQVLADLPAARGASIENLYTYIYRQAWDRLDEEVRELFLVMPLAAEAGCDLAFLEEVSEVDAGTVRRALEVLVNRSLVDVRGTLTERRYAIHNLTRSFLMEQVARWK